MIQCYKLGLNIKEISSQICVKPMIVPSLIEKLKSWGEREIPRHLYVVIGVQGSVGGRRLTQDINWNKVGAFLVVLVCLSVCLSV